MSGRRAYGTGQLYAKHSAWYGRWRTSDGRRLNRRLGPVRSIATYQRGEPDREPRHGRGSRKRF